MFLIAQLDATETWMEFARTFGFPALLVVGLLVGLYKLGRLGIEQVAVPVVQKMIASVEHTDRAVDDSVKALNALLVTLTQMNGRHEQISIVLADISHTLELMNKRIEKLESNAK